MRETGRGGFQERLVREIEALYPDALILRNDPNHTQGIPDLLILRGDHWAALEVKAAMNSPRQPNQEWYVDRMNEMSFAAFICPENKETVIDALQQALGPVW